MKKLEYHETDSFTKDFKKLSKKYKTLLEDISVAKRSAIELFHLRGVDNKSVAELTGFYRERHKIYKLRKFACKSLKGKGAKSGIRIIYAFDDLKYRVTFIEIYYKGDQANESKDKIEYFLKSVHEAERELEIIE